MTPVVLGLCLGFLCFLFTLWAFTKDEEFGWIVVVVLTAGLWLTGYRSTPEFEAGQAKDKVVAYENAVREATPHVIRDSGDGCKVYTFKSEGRWHYFTRCFDSNTVTESSREESCGKNCKKTIVETIPMEGVKKHGK